LRAGFFRMSAILRRGRLGVSMPNKLLSVSYEVDLPSEELRKGGTRVTFVLICDHRLEALCSPCSHAPRPQFSEMFNGGKELYHEV
jgi:hypothetical protein